MFFFWFVYLWRIFFPQVSIRIVTAMFRATQSSISELLFFFRLNSFLFYSNIAIITFSFAVTVLICY